MSDITNLFRATVKTVRTRLKSQGQNTGTDHNLLSQSKQKGDFAVKSKNVVASITQLRDFLLNHRKDYISVASCVGQGQSSMSDAERDQIDTDAQTFMRTCSEAIKLLRTEAFSSKVMPQVEEHREEVLHMLDHYLKVVCKIYSEQRAIRVKRVVDRKRLSRLEPDVKRRKSSEGDKTKTTNSGDTEENRMDTKEAKDEPETRASSQDPPPLFDVPQGEEELSLEEAQMFAEENEQLFREMNSMVDEVKQIEGKIVEISRLQEIFADKVLEQESDIDRIADTVVGATENIKEANEEIREAMKNNAGLRVWILFFLIVCSFSLLFLDWYNP